MVTALRALSSIGVLTPAVESVVLMCADSAAADAGVRIAAAAVLTKTPCSEKVDDLINLHLCLV